MNMPFSAKIQVQSHTAIREYYPSISCERKLRSYGFHAFPVIELNPQTNARSFEVFAESAKVSHGPLGACLHVYPARTYETMRLFMERDGNSGFALKGQEIVSVFCNTRRYQRPATPSLMALATQLGGRLLNAFDTGLPSIYEKCGFRQVARLAWNDRLAPKDWNYHAMAMKGHERPDVVFMVHTNRRIVPVVAHSFNEAVQLQLNALEPDFFGVVA